MLEIARDSKGRLRTSEKTVSIKVKLEESKAGQLRDMAEQLDVPMASIIRQSIIKALEALLIYLPLLNRYKVRVHK